ncbi:MAG: sugar phosphate nucleotidyltransferase, partial [Nanoarchaeota archaeon]
MENQIALVFMVAGISSRFGGKIKQFAKVTDTETLIEYSLNQALKSGFSKIIFIVGNKTQFPFKEKFGNEYKGIPVEYALQTYDETKRDKPWGTTDALCSIRDIINCPFIVCNGDDIYGKNTFRILFNHLKNNKNNDDATAGYKLIEVLPEKGGVNRGIFNIENNYVKDMNETFNIEKSNLSATNTNSDDLCSMNIFALHPRTLKL